MKSLVRPLTSPNVALAGALMGFQPFRNRPLTWPRRWERVLIRWRRLLHRAMTVIGLVGAPALIDWQARFLSGCSSNTDPRNLMRQATQNCPWVGEIRSKDWRDQKREKTHVPSEGKKMHKSSSVLLSNSFWPAIHTEEEMPWSWQSWQFTGRDRCVWIAEVTSGSWKLLNKPSLWQGSYSWPCFVTVAMTILWSSGWRNCHDYAVVAIKVAGKFLVLFKMKVQSIKPSQKRKEMQCFWRTEGRQVEAERFTRCDRGGGAGTFPAWPDTFPIRSGHLTKFQFLELFHLAEETLACFTWKGEECHMLRRGSTWGGFIGVFCHEMWDKSSSSVFTDGQQYPGSGCVNDRHLHGWAGLSNFGWTLHWIDEWSSV